LLFDQEEKWLLNEISWMLSRRLLGRVPSSPVRHFTLSTIRRHSGGGADTVAFVMIYVTNAGSRCIAQCRISPQSQNLAKLRVVTLLNGDDEQGQTA